MMIEQLDIQIQKKEPLHIPYTKINQIDSRVKCKT